MSKSRDSEIRMYVSGRLDRDGTGRIERQALSDRGTQARLDALRHQSIALRRAFTFPPFDLSSIQVGVRARSPYRAVGIAPVAALWLQIAGMALVLVLLHRTGAYVAPPDVRLERSEGRVLVDSRPLSAAHRGRIVMNQEVQTTAGAQAVLVLDHANRVALAPDTSLIVQDPRENVRQVMGLVKGEIWARFSAAGHRFAVSFGRGQFEVSGSTAEFDLVSGDRALALLPLNLPEAPAAPVAVLRVFRGSVNARQGYEAPRQVNRDQWMVFYPKAAPAIGEQGSENFKLLRIDQSERFKDGVHWLDTRSYPLRAENSTLELERRLRKLAASLLRYREQNVVRNGRAEILAFEAEIQKSVREARERIAAGTPLPDDRLPPPGPLRMRDEELAASVGLLDEILGRWVTRADSYATLGSAAKTLLGRSQVLEQELNVIDQDLVKAIVLMEDMVKLRESIAGHDAEISRLRESPGFDPDESKRKAFDLQIEEQRRLERLGGEARTKIELLRFRLNSVEARLDDARRQRAPLADAVRSRQAALDDITARQKTNPYSAEKLAYARRSAEDLQGRVGAARARSVTLDDDIKTLEKNLPVEQKAVQDTEARLAQAKTNEETLANRHALAEAEAKKASEEVTEAEAEVTRIQRLIDALPEKDRKDSPLQQDLTKAKVRANDANAKARRAVLNQDAALEEWNEAVKDLTDARTTHESAAAHLALTQKSLTDARKESDELKVALPEMESALKAAQDDVKAQESAKVELEQLSAQWGEAVDALSAAEFALEDQDVAIKALDDDAAPLREELATLLSAIEAGDKAKDEIRRLDTEKQKCVAVGQDIARREAARKALATSHDEIKAMPLVAGYDGLRAEFSRLHAERAALEYLRARALQEDGALARKQAVALERYNETAQKAEIEAVALLSSFCAPYRGFELADSEAEAEVVRKRVMETLWRLYYTGEPELRADGRAMQCYYVLAETGYSAEALRELDQRWAAALVVLLGRERFETAVKLEAADLLSLSRR